MALNDRKENRRQRAEADRAQGVKLGQLWTRRINARTRQLSERVILWQRARPRNRRLLYGLLVVFFITYLIYLIILISSSYGATTTIQ